MSELLSRLQSALGDTYRIDSELGGGGMSRVFLAEETRLGRQVVIKVLPPEMAAGVSVERFEREIQLAASLQHPHIEPLLTAGSAESDLLYYVMPFIEGESLRAKLAREGELPIEETVRILREVMDALAHAHRNKVVHRDIKPDNVLLSGSHALVADFGVAKILSQNGARLAAQFRIRIDQTQFEREPLTRLAQDGQLMAFQHEGFWQCMDTLRDRKLLQRIWDTGDAPWKVRS